MLDYLKLMADNRARADGHAAERRAKVLYASEKTMKRRKKRVPASKQLAKRKWGSWQRSRKMKRDAKGHFISKAAARRKTQRLTAKRRVVSSNRRASGTSGISRRSRKRTTTHSSASEASPMAKGKKGKGKRSAAKKIKRAKRATVKTPRRRARTSRRSTRRERPWEKGLRAARRARRRNKRAHRKHPVRSYSYHRKPKRVRVRAHRSYERPRRRRTAAQRRASRRNLAKARRGHRRGHRRARYAMENPLGGLELFVGSLTGLIGFGGADFVDRLIATHALTPKGSPTAAGIQLYMDTPPTTGSYTGLYNPSAITAPMNLTRWAVGGLMTVVPLGLAHYVKGPVGRSSLQMFGFGAGIRILGKGLLDLLAMLTKNTSTGQRLYDGELRAMALHRGDGSEANLPSAGLGRPALAAKPHGTGCACTACANKTPDQLAGRPTGTVGWPSMPREVAPSLTPPPPPPPPVPIPVVQATTSSALTGLPKPRNPYRWGEEAA